MGRLVEVRLASPVTAAEIHEADAAMASIAARVGPVVIAADYRAASVLPQALAQELVRLFRRHNTHIERSAVLIASDSAMAILQMERMIREADLPTRRFFRDGTELIEWLGESLSDAEYNRLIELATTG